MLRYGYSESKILASDHFFFFPIASTTPVRRSGGSVGKISIFYLAVKQTGQGRAGTTRTGPERATSDGRQNCNCKNEIRSSRWNARSLHVILIQVSQINVNQ